MCRSQPRGRKCRLRRVLIPSPPLPFRRNRKMRPHGRRVFHPWSRRMPRKKSTHRQMPILRELEPGKEANKTGDPPSPEEQNRLIGEIDSIYKTARARTRQTTPLWHANFWRTDERTSADRARRFVLLRRAGEIARDAGEAELLLEAWMRLSPPSSTSVPFR